MVVSRANPLYRASLKRAPAKPLGDRIIIRQMPLQDTSDGGLVKPDVAKERQFGGKLLAVGDDAADKLYDYGVELGDEIWFGKYAGVIEEWQHIIKPGSVDGCPHDSAWDFLTKDDPAWAEAPTDGMISELRACRTCGAVRVSERIIVAHADDIICDVDLQERVEAGAVTCERRETADGKTRYTMIGQRDTFSTGPRA